METELTIEGISCENCSETIENKMLSNPRVETVFNSLNKSMLFVHKKNNSSQNEFLISLSDTPYLLGQVIELNNCHCCKEVQFEFSLR